MMRRILVLGVGSGNLAAGDGEAQGTKLWTVDRYDAMETRDLDGVAIRNDGRLEAGPAKSLLYDTGKSYVWSLGSDTAGNAYLGLGGTASDRAW